RGEVREINIRSTVINTNDNIDVIVPNSEFVNFPVTNWTMNERFLRLKIPFGVAYRSDKELVRRIIVDAALALPYTLNLTERQYPQVRLKNFGDSSLDFELVVWIKAEWANRPGRVKAAYNWEIETALVKHDVEIPFPQREVRVLGQQEQEAISA
ncbi:MAG: mechanosensitive ion channel, partial [Cocleimonas sp.]|nr:mechanosensitive ion channel [Cocleimonas sp.]